MRNIIHCPLQTAILSAVAALGCLAGGPALADDSIATNCRNSNTTGNAWRTVTQLTNSAKIGDVLQERAINHFVEYKSTKGSEPHELVLSGRWTGVGYPQAFGAVRTNIDAKEGGTAGGIGFRVLYTNNNLGLKTVIPNSSGPIVLDKRRTSDLAPNQWDATVATYIQQLILLTEPANLPTGELRVTSLGSARLELGTTDTVKDALSVGGAFEPPTTNQPSGVCRQTYTLSSAEILSMGGGSPPPPIVNKCKVDITVVPVPLGHFSLNEVLSSPTWTSTQREFKLSFSECSAQTKPQIWFHDKNTPANASDTLSLAGAGATGIGIAMYAVPTAGSPRRVRYAANAPGNDEQYKLEHLDNDRAQLTLRAQYVRNGDQVVKAGQANGTAQFTVTYP